MSVQGDLGITFKFLGTMKVNFHSQQKNIKFMLSTATLAYSMLLPILQIDFSEWPLPKECGHTGYTAIGKLALSAHCLAAKKDAKRQKKQLKQIPFYGVITFCSKKLSSSLQAMPQNPLLVGWER